MPTKLIGAVVRGIDTAPGATEWLLFGNHEVQNALSANPPPAGENFTVVWETRETSNGRETAIRPFHVNVPGINLKGVRHHEPNHGHTTSR